MSFADMLCADSLENEHVSADAFAEIVARIVAGEPVQYILGEETFFGRTFSVGDGVLIPRPETEELCLWVIEECRMKNTECRILDIGTGSGAIAITLAKEISPINVTAIDISDKALAIAQSNAERLGANITFIKQDILATTVPNGFAVDQTATIFPCGILPSPCGGAGGGRAFDIIVSNPPYIMEKEQAEMSAHVLDHEPSIALFVPDSDPLLFYRAIADFALLHLSPGGMLFFEINPLCAEEMLQMLSDKGFSNIQLRKDQFGKQRMIKATR